MSSIPTIFSYKESFATTVKAHHTDYMKVDQQVRDEVAPRVLEFLKSWPNTMLIRLNGGTTKLAEQGAMRIVDLKVIVAQGKTDTEQGGGRSGSWTWKGNGDCVVTVQSIG